MKRMKTLNDDRKLLKQSNAINVDMAAVFKSKSDFIFSLHS